MATITDRIIPYYVWFVYGFGTIGVVMGITNFGMSLVTMITVKGIFIPSWMIPVVGCSLIIICTAVGYYFERYSIFNRINSHTNQNMNPEIKQLSEDVKEIKKLLEKK